MDNLPVAPASSRFELGRSELWMLAGFLLTLLALDALFNRSGYAFLTPRPHVTNQLALLACRELPQPADVLLLGSSRFDAGLDPRILQERLSAELSPEPFSVYRLTLQGLRPWMLYLTLRDLVARLPPRRLLLIALETRYFYVPFEGATTTLGLRMLGSARDWLELSPIGLAADELRELSLCPLRGLQAPWNLDWLCSSKTQSFVDELHQNHGFLVREYRPMTPEQIQAARARSRNAPAVTSGFDRRPYNSLDTQAFDLVLDLLARLPCRSAFIGMPLQGEFDREEQPEEYRRFETEIVPECERRGLAYIDLNRPPFPDEAQHFASPDHLNARGRVLTSQLFVREILEPLLRGEPLRSGR